MENRQKTKILQRITESDCLPSPSPVLIHLIELASDESTSVSDLSRVLEQDPGLTTRLIKLANNAFYARGKKVSTISQAILMVGFNRVRIMALSLSLRDSFPLGRLGGMDYEYFWKTSLYRALIAQGFAQTMPSLDSLQDEEVFTAALILGIGMLMLHHVSPEELKDSFPGDASLSELILWEERHLGINHRQIGRIVLSRWRFPEKIIESQKHYGLDALKDERSHFCKILEIARSSTEIFFGKREDFGFLREVPPILGIGQKRVHEILSESFSRVEEIADYLRLKACSADDMLSVMEKANRALAGINGSLQVNLGKIISMVSHLEEPQGVEKADLVKETRKTVANVLDAVVHEIRNPLMAIGGFAQRLAKNTETKDNLLRYANIIVQESCRLQQALNELVSLSQAYAPDGSEGNLVETLNEAIHELRSVFEGKKIEIVKNYEQEPLVIHMDQEGIKKALHHLLESLIRLIGKDEVKIRIELLLSRATGAVKISICITGLALPEHVKKMLSGSNFSSKSFDSGFGLLKAWKILEAHNGHIEIETEDNTHCFAIHLPVALE